MRNDFFNTSTGECRLPLVLTLYMLHTFGMGSLFVRDELFYHVPGDKSVKVSGTSLGISRTIFQQQICCSQKPANLNVLTQNKIYKICLRTSQCMSQRSNCLYMIIGAKHSYF